MLTKEDLLQIGELFEPINKRLDGIEKNMVTKSDLEANNRVFGTIIKVELAETNKRIDSVVAAMKAGFQKTSKQVEHKLDNAVQDHEDRIEIIEEHLGLPHKN